MRRQSLAVMCVVVVCSAFVARRPVGRAKSSERRADAKLAVRAALDSMGGVDAVRAIARVRVDGAGYAVGDGNPGALTVFAFTETRDDHSPRLVQDVAVVTRPGASQRSVRTLTRTSSGVRIEASGRTVMRDARAMDDWFTEAPENVLLAAVDASDLTDDGDSGARFTWQGRAVHVRFAAPGGMLAAVELDSATTMYSQWKQEDGGTRYPHQWNITRGGVAVEAFTADRVTVER